MLLRSVFGGNFSRTPQLFYKSYCYNGHRPDQTRTCTAWLLFHLAVRPAVAIIHQPRQNPQTPSQSTPARNGPKTWVIVWPKTLYEYELPIESNFTTNYFEGRWHVPKEFVLAGAKSDPKKLYSDRKNIYSDLRGRGLNIPREPGTAV